MHYLLIYELAPDYLARRGEFRDEHLQLAWDAQERGEIVIAGALADPADQAILLFSGDSPAAAERFAKADPYVAQGLVTSWRVRQWNTVIGTDAANPVRP
ncbi:YciI-like protein [Massilia phyllosphaerae]|uniref:YciI-like protein n=1 Tax=Massilia phyllosphaerae TaxID=3106034 RepID=UPI002B1CC78F|nr:YciI-like protein [Massilia sp. SGZ-792]